MKTIKKSRFVTITSLLMGFVSLISFCFGSWTFIQDKTINAFEVSDAKPVAYISSDNKTKYTTIEKALSKAKSGETVFVIPGANPTTKNKTLTIAEGVTLCLPYENETYLLEKGNNGSGFADNDTSKRKNLVTFSNCTITVNGTLRIGGVTGTVGQQGATSGNYSEIMLDSSNIIVHGRIENYGFIKEKERGTCSILFEEDPKLPNLHPSLDTPIVFYDYSSAGTIYDYYKNGVFPFEKFDIPQIQPPMIFNYGTTVTTKIHTYGASVGDLNQSATIVGKDNALICMNSGSKIIWDFDSTSLNKTDNGFEHHKTTVYIYGQAYLGGIEIKIKLIGIIDFNINSKEFFLPMPMGFKINLEDEADFSIPSGMTGVKFMPGSALNCKKGAKLYLKSPTIFYQNCTATDGSTFNYGNTTSAAFNNSGYVEITSGFDGQIDAPEYSGRINVLDGFGNVSGSKEGTGSSTYSWGTKIRNIKQVYVANDDYSWSFNDEGTQTLAKTSYTAKPISSTNEFGWLRTNNIECGVRYTLNSATADNSKNLSNDHFFLESGRLNLANPTNSDSSLAFAGFYYDASFSDKLDIDATNNYYLETAKVSNNLGSNNFVQLYCKWIAAVSKKFEVKVINSTTSDHLVQKTEEKTTMNVVGDAFYLPKTQPSYYLYKKNSDTSGSISIFTFEGYSISISNKENLEIANYLIDSKGNSENGFFSDFKQVDTSFFEDGYIIQATSRFKEEKTSFEFSISCSAGTSKKTSLPKNGGSANATLNGLPSVFLQRVGLRATLNWNGDSPISIPDSSLETIKIINSSTKNVTYDMTKTLKCNIAIGSLSFVVSTSIYLECSILD